MNVVYTKTSLDCTCDECGCEFKKDIDYRIAVITRNKDLILCKNCYSKLVIKICTTNL